MLMTKINVVMKRPHSVKQEGIITHPGNVAILAGRRFGKTDGLVQRVFYHMVKNPGLYWWVGLSWRSASMKRAWREVSSVAIKLLKSMGITERGYINRSSHEVIIPGLGEIWFRTADNPSSLAGEGIMGAVLDEFSLMQEIVWTEYVQATLLDHGGWCAFAGVPKGNNWAGNLWRAAGDREDWLQVHATSYDNPFIDHSLVDKIKSEVTENLFNQEYLAMIVNDAGMVFRRVIDAAVSVFQDRAVPGAQYVAGVDVADKNDYTVISVIDTKTKSQVYMDRVNKVGYEVLASVIKSVYNRFSPIKMLIEDNSIGTPIIDRLRADGFPVTGFTTTTATKEPLIQNLQAAFEHREIKILNDPVLINELQAYESKRSKAGNFSYSAPSGMHDDTVIALALSWWCCKRRGVGFA